MLIFTSTITIHHTFDKIVALAVFARFVGQLQDRWDNYLGSEEINAILNAVKIKSNDNSDIL